MDYAQRKVIIIRLSIRLSEQRISQAVVHRLDLGVVLQGVGAELAADTGLLEATEWGLVGDQVVVVDPHGTVMVLVVALLVLD